VYVAPSWDKIDRWRRTFLEHHEHAAIPRRCAADGCGRRFPCPERIEAAELLIVAGIGVPPAGG
jgi:hypothetical protein